MKPHGNEKELTLLRALVDRKGLQSIADTASAVLGNPVFFCDLGYKIICHSDRDADYDAFWEYIKSSSYSQPEQIAEIMRSGDLSKVYASDEPQSGKYAFADAPFLAARVRDGIHVLGHVCVYGCNRPFAPEDKELLILLCKVVSYEMMYRGMSALYQIPYYTLLTDLLSETLTDETELDARLKCLSVPLPKEMHVVVVRFGREPGQVSTYFIREFLMQNLPQTLSIVYQEKLVFLMSPAHLENGALERLLTGYQENIDFRIGISNKVTEFKLIPAYYRQAINALDIARTLKLEDCCCWYRKLNLYQILLYAKQEADLESLCDPAVLAMRDYDRQNHTEYIHDLTAYLASGKNITQAAKLACVHKNSMYYRISRMEEKFGVSLSDEDTCLALRLSLKILELLKDG